MKQSLLVLAGAVVAWQTAFAMTIKRDSSPSTWALYFWEGEQCTSSETSAVTGPASEHKGSICNAVPERGITSSADFYAASSNFQLIFASDSDCSDTLGSLIVGVNNEPTCIEVPNQASHYKITTT